MGGRDYRMIVKRIAALLSAAVIMSAAAAAQEYDDPDVELVAEFDNEVVDNTGEYDIEFTVGFGTHMQLSADNSAKLVITAENAELEGADESGERVYGYSSIANEKYVCTQSSSGGYYPNYGETVRARPTAEKGAVNARLTISDGDNNITHTEEMRVYILNRDNVIVISDEGYDDCEKKLDKPLYKLLLFLKTPLGTAVKIVLFVLLIGIAYLTLNYKSVRRKIRQRRADKQQRKEGN